ncbi:hypothetical protein F3Y22_tig00116939pilonHSYRG00044 [Hibiscus syriacus]|uniref:Uncharacterized protein n=1 Tax=Hibiscus syriacus TaxID=106335 RepID=A0A6A2Y0M5_HIBSY|nr:hypothetical protein F3Y22_tig00116939pilonHSYRG00044 [Hibiscus syriacus]
MAKDIEVGGGEFQAKDYHDPLPAPLVNAQELTKWSFYRATDPAKGGEDCGGVGILGITWAFGGMIFILVYCTAGYLGGTHQPSRGANSFADGYSTGNVWAPKLSTPLFSSTLFSLQLIPRGMQETPISLSWHHFPLGKDMDDHWIFWVGPFIGAAIAAIYHQFILRASAAKAMGSFRSRSAM